MALVVKDRVRETSTSSGTGDLILNGAVQAFQDFSIIGDGNTTYYTIVDATTGEFEVGIGTYTLSTTTLSRDTVLESSDGGAAINFTTNVKDVFVTYPAERSVYVDGGAISPATASRLGFNNLAQGSGLSVLGVSGASTANVASIAAGTDHQVFRRSGSAVSFGPVALDQSAAVAGLLPVVRGGSGAGTLTGYIQGNGTSAFTASATIPNTDITGLGTMSTQNSNNVSITGGSVSGITDLAVADGGTGASTVSAALTNLGAYPDTNPDGYTTNTGTVTSVSGTGTVNGISLSGTVNTSGDITLGGVLSDVSLTTQVLGVLPLANGGTNATTATGARTNLGLGTMSTQNANSVNIDGGTINDTSIGASTPSTGAFTNFTASGTAQFTSTGAVTVAKGTTAERPASPQAGDFRFNTQTSEFEGFNGSAFASVGGAALQNDTTTSTDVFPLFADATTGTAANVFTSNAKLLYKPSTGEFKSEALVATNGIVVNSATIDTDYTIAAGSNGHSVGPITVDAVVTVDGVWHIS